ncbi:hypothetical protein [Pseudomonas sp.]|uniref:hypothetical protein n=1 Tax=Pseudomonas sp. TaxID=306 RepID=UPI0027310C71|nr:hypothetical protein [Pseudomonas sp.]MDP2242613.1 hypothetical protein [Pseudomonas sp.]
MSRTLLTLMLCLLPCALLANNLDGYYLATLDGQPAEMHLRSQDQQVSGEYIEGRRLRLRISGHFDGQLLNAQISDAQSAQPIARMRATYTNGVLTSHITARSPVTGETLERRAVFNRQRFSDAAITSQANRQFRDPELIATWVHEQITRSEDTSAASTSTLLILQLTVNGGISQWSRSAADNSDWHPDAPGELHYTGRWLASNGVLEVQLQDQNDYQPTARYHFSDDYLVTESSTGTRRWQRRP